MTSKKAIVIDGNSLAYRAFYATYAQAEYSMQRNLQPVNALKMMIDLCFKLKNSGNYSYCLVAFDHGKKNFRHKVFADYKAGRKQTPDAMISQLPLICKALKYMGYNTLSLDQIEADDIIGSFAQKMNKEHIKVDIYSSDKDMLQLVNEFTDVHLIKTGLTKIQINNFANFKFLNNDLLPNQIPDFKAIVGDKSDNLIGVKGIGESVAIKLLLKYENLENIYNHLNELSEAVSKKFIAAKTTSVMCKDLATIKLNILDDYHTSDFLFKSQNNQAIIQMLKEYNINGLYKYLKDDEPLSLEAFY